jgi:hypothetical protein
MDDPGTFNECPSRAASDALLSYGVMSTTLGDGAQRGEGTVTLAVAPPAETR